MVLTNETPPGMSEPEPPQRSHNRAIAAAAGGVLALGAAVFGFSKLHGEDTPAPTAAATGISGETPAPHGSSDVPTATAPGLSPSELPSLISSRGPLVSENPKPSPSVPLVSIAPTPTSSPSASEAAQPAKDSGETGLDKGTIVLPFVTDTPEKRKGKSEEQLIAAYEIPVENYPLDNDARKAEAMRAFKTYITRLVQWRSLGNTTSYDYLYNSFTHMDEWKTATPKLGMSIFPKALSGKLLDKPDYKSTRDFYEEFGNKIVPGDLTAYAFSVGEVHAEQNNESYNSGDQLWRTKGAYRPGYAIKLDEPEAIIQGKDLFRIDYELIDYNNAPVPPDPEHPKVIQRTRESIDERAANTGKGDANHFEIFLEIGKGVNGNSVWLFSERQS